MSWFRSTVAAFGIGFITLTQAQTIKPDTLEDLKAEYEFQQKQALPYISAYETAFEAQYQCALRVMRKPLETTCDNEERNVLIAKRDALEPLTKLSAAKEAYEREQRKADRKNQGKATISPVKSR